ncbi:hypothetical protein PMAYCL1PPCAC_08690, partial [Pristionchus mayeri]
GSVFIYIQMQLCNYSLSSWLDENNTLDSRSLPKMKSWFKQIVEAVAYIHHNNLIHRDLKPSNILISERERLKICDLGIAAERRPEDKEESILQRSLIGTPLYMSPEQRSGKDYGSKTDVFALGLILAELCVVMTTIERPQIFNDYRAGKQCDRIRDEKTANFVATLTQVDPKNRPSSREMLDHLYLA